MTDRTIAPQTPSPRDVSVGPVRVGPDQPLTIIAGPCLAESEDLCLEIGQALRDRCGELGLGYIFKASFDKANRSSIHSYRGLGLAEGLEVLARVKTQLGVPVTTDIHEPGQASVVAQVADLLQIPAFLCRQTDLLIAAAQTGLPVNVKKGQFLSPPEMRNVIAKLQEASSAEGRNHPLHTNGIILTERGTFFGYHRLVNDFVGVGDLMALGHPVCFDVTHSTQMPGDAQGGTASGGRPDRATLLARCALAAGVQALFVETHPDPARALSDASSMLPLSQTVQLLESWLKLYETNREILAQP